MGTKTIDKKTMSEEAEHAISFASRKIDGVLDLGHAFMVWYALEDDGKKYIKRSIGFYPVGNKYKLVAAADGMVLDDSEIDIDTQLIVQVSTPVFEDALGVDAQYVNATWVLGVNDCVSFVESVAAVVPTLIVPNRALNPTPSAFVAAMFSAN